MTTIHTPDGTIGRIAELENELRQANKQIRMFQGLKDAAVSLAASHEKSIDQLTGLLREAVEHLPGWAGVNDDAHGWYVRVKQVIGELDQGPQSEGM